MTARAVTSMRTLPFTNAVGMYPSGPSISTDAFSLLLPAMHVPEGPQTGYWSGQVTSSTQGMSPPAVPAQAVTPSASAARIRSELRLDDLVMPGPQKAKSAVATPARTSPPASPMAL